MDTNGPKKEGERIKSLLDSSGLTVQDLARAGGVSWQAAKKWVQSDSLGPGARETCAAALVKVGLDPRAIWPMTSTPTIDVERLADLKALLQGFTSDQLERVKRLLEAERGDQIRLVDFIDGITFAHKT